VSSRWAAAVAKQGIYQPLTLSVAQFGLRPRAGGTRRRWSGDEKGRLTPAGVVRPQF